MAICEICGDETKLPHRVSVEGSTLVACARCARMGVDLGEANPSFVAAGKRVRREDPEIAMAEGYGSLIKEARTKRGLKQEELARKIFEPDSTISKLEAEKMTPSEEMARKLERTLGIKLIELVTHVPPERSELGKSLTLGDVVSIRKRRA